MSSIKSPDRHRSGDDAKPKGTSLIPIDPPECEKDRVLKGKSRQEATIIANRILWTKDLKPNAVRKLIMAVNACGPSVPNCSGKKKGKKKKEEISSALFCETCLENVAPDGWRRCVQNTSSAKVRVCSRV